MAFQWGGELLPGAEVGVDELEAAGLGRDFATQAEAEAWLTASYEDLVDLGVDQVSLFEEDRLVYGPMSLSDV